MKKTKASSPRDPHDIPIPQNTLLENGSMFVVLEDLDELDEFWRENRDKFSFGCNGMELGEPRFLRDKEWVFGLSKESVVETALRWTEFGIKTEFNDLSVTDPSFLAYMARDRIDGRKEMIEKGIWTSENEQEFNSDPRYNPPGSYKGCWELTNLPYGIEWYEWIRDGEELWDPSLDVKEVTRQFQIQTFDDWEGECDGVIFYAAPELDSNIEEWKLARAERDVDGDFDYYYGCDE